MLYKARKTQSGSERCCQFSALISQWAQVRNRMHSCAWHVMFHQASSRRFLVSPPQIPREQGMTGISTNPVFIEEEMQVIQAGRSGEEPGGA